METKRREIVYYQTKAGKKPHFDFVFGLKDPKVKAILKIRTTRASLGNFGDHAPVGEGVFEMRIHVGPGYRIYYGQDGEILVVVLTSGAKKSQRKDIKAAKEFWQDYLKRK